MRLLTDSGRGACGSTATLGSTVALTDSAGNVANTYAYEPYGKVSSSTGTVTNPWQFGGSYGAFTDATGLLKIGQRFYDPDLGRWTQQDPVRGLNMYICVADNPANYIDPSGATCTAVQTAGYVAGAVIGAAGIFAFGFAAITLPPAGVVLGISGVFLGAVDLMAGGIDAGFCLRGEGVL